MDGFIDKFAQRKNAQEMIRANAMAEAEEKERMASRLSEYEQAIKEMRNCNLQIVENAEKVRELLAASLNKIEEVQKKDAGMDLRSEELIREIKGISEELGNRMTELLKMQNDQGAIILEEQKNQMTELLKEQKDQTGEFWAKQSELFERQDAQMQELLEKQKTTLEELLHDTEDFTHKESVKVYRNVQAVIESALPKQTEEITEAIKNEVKDNGVSGGFKVIWILTLIAALANVAIEVLKVLGYM